MRKLVYYVACTVDGFIAREDGSFDFFPSEGDQYAFLFSEFPETIPAHLRDALGVDGENKHFDTVLMGRGTYEVGSVLGITSPYPHMRQIVVSRSMAAPPDPAIELVGDDVVGAVRRLKQEEGLDVWLCGGADPASALYREIDELMLKVNPVALGRGLPLFGGVEAPVGLEFVANRIFDSGFMFNHYRVRR